MEIKEGPTLLHPRIALLYHRLETLDINVALYERSFYGDFIYFEYGANSFCILFVNGFQIFVEHYLDVPNPQFKVACKTLSIALFGAHRCEDRLDEYCCWRFDYNETNIDAFVNTCQAMHLQTLSEYKEFLDTIYKSSATLVLCLKKHNIPKDVANMFGRFLVQETKFPKCEIWGK